MRARERGAADHPAAGGYGSRMDRLGLRAADVFAIARALARDCRALPARGVIAVAKALVASNVFDARQVAYDLLRRHRAAAAALAAADVERLGKGMDNWASVDTFSCLVSGPAWREGRLTDAHVARWARSRDRWWRRAALASTVALNVRARGGAGDVPRTLAMCERLVADRDDMVVKALSWALRCAAAHDAGAVRRFIVRHADAIAPRARREVTNKLATGYKSPRRRTRGAARP